MLYLNSRYAYWVDFQRLLLAQHSQSLLGSCPCCQRWKKLYKILFKMVEVKAMAWTESKRILSVSFHWDEYWRGRGDYLGQTEVETFTNIYLKIKKWKCKSKGISGCPEAFLLRPRENIVFWIFCKYFFNTKLLINYQNPLFWNPVVGVLFESLESVRKSLIYAFPKWNISFCTCLNDIAWHFQNSSFSSQLFFFSPSQNYLLILTQLCK